MLKEIDTNLLTTIMKNNNNAVLITDDAQMYHIKNSGTGELEFNKISKDIEQSQGELIGDLSQLVTSKKDNIVKAINEVFDYTSEVYTELDAMKLDKDNICADIEGTNEQVPSCTTVKEAIEKIYDKINLSIPVIEFSPDDIIEGCYEVYNLNVNEDNVNLLLQNSFVNVKSELFGDDNYRVFHKCISEPSRIKFISLDTTPTFPVVTATQNALSCKVFELVNENNKWIVKIHSVTTICLDNAGLETKMFDELGGRLGNVENELMVMKDVVPASDLEVKSIVLTSESSNKKFKLSISEEGALKIDSLK